MSDKFLEQQSSYGGLLVDVKTLNTTSTATGGALAWVNPRGNKVMASVSVYFSTAGTGTFDLGTGSDGTGANAALIDGGTLAVGVKTSIIEGGTLGATRWFVLPTSGTAGDSVVMQMSDTATSTAVGKAIIEYMDV